MQNKYMDSLIDLIDLLEYNHQSANNGRGIAVVRTLVWNIKLGQMDQVKNIIANNRKELAAYPRIIRILEEYKLWSGQTTISV